MGFMTEISILNDRWHDIKKDPKRFVDEINELMNGRPRYGDVNEETGRREYLDSPPCDTGTGQFTVYQSHHADDPRLYLAWRNSFRSMDYWDIDKEFGDRLNNEPHLIEVFEREIEVAERKLKDAKVYLKEKKEKVAA